ncbi:uncharacterized protein LOC114243978 [Bombyx mandarina]|uniref:Uncharacterized protein n=3 Tax=Bombyx TaxID=7090 RepID=A0A8R2C5R5_BOMMO|nr:uncharacterized protein LOC101745862 [Bombyx mori]XP_028031449.1 uncharacterized protein LOC114243978 [Bombyx mandarina]
MLRFIVCLAVLIPRIECGGYDVIEDELRTKRQINSLPLVYPYGGTYKLLIGFSSPIKTQDNVALLFAANFQYQYVQFANISELSQYYVYKEVTREQRDADIAARRDERYVFYKSFADLLTAKGFNGFDCVLRAICEAAQYPVEDEGFVGEILHILLTPDYGKTPFDEPDPDWEDMMSPYIDAATAGRQMFNCASIYSSCPEGQGVLELISALRDE